MHPCHCTLTSDFFHFNHRSLRMQRERIAQRTCPLRGRLHLTPGMTSTSFLSPKFRYPSPSNPADQVGHHTPCPKILRMYLNKHAMWPGPDVISLNVLSSIFFPVQYPFWLYLRNSHTGSTFSGRSFYFFPGDIVNVLLPTHKLSSVKSRKDQRPAALAQPRLSPPGVNSLPQPWMLWTFTTKCSCSVLIRHGRFGSLHDFRSRSFNHFPYFSVLLFTFVSLEYNLWVSWNHKEQVGWKEKEMAQRPIHLDGKEELSKSL